MIEKEYAIEVQHLALQIITQITKLLNQAQGRCSPDVYKQLKEGVGRSIGTVQMGILEVIIAEFPELDDLQ